MEMMELQDLLVRKVLKVTLDQLDHVDSQYDYPLHYYDYYYYSLFFPDRAQLAHEESKEYLVFLVMMETQVQKDKEALKDHLALPERVVFQVYPVFKELKGQREISVLKERKETQVTKEKMEQMEKMEMKDLPYVIIVM